jgi:hypothetical protein
VVSFLSLEMGSHLRRVIASVAVVGGIEVVVVEVVIVLIGVVFVSIVVGNAV